MGEFCYEINSEVTLPKVSEYLEFSTKIEDRSSVEKTLKGTYVRMSNYYFFYNYFGCCGVKLPQCLPERRCFSIEDYFYLLVYLKIM